MAPRPGWWSVPSRSGAATVSLPPVRPATTLALALLLVAIVVAGVLSLILAG